MLIVNECNLEEVTPDKKQDELQEIVIALWREGRDKFYYGRYVLANITNCCNRGDYEIGVT